VDSNTNLFIRDFWARVTFVETEVRLDSAITVNQFHISKEVKVSANALKDKTIKTVKP
jgi:hypothetical protein